MQWFRLAAKLGKTLQEVQSQTTSSEFSEWIAFMNNEQVTGLDRVDVYLAQLTAEVRRSWVDHPEKVVVKDFIIDFTPPKPKPELTPAERLGISKAYWKAVAAKGRIRKVAKK